jgi:adenylate cyclase
VTGRAFQTLAALVLSALWALALGYGHLHGDVPLLDRVEGALTDLRVAARGQRTAPDIVTIVAIDDDTAAKRGGYPLPRAELATIVDAIARSEPRVIALDLLLLDHGNEQGDTALAQALGKRPAVIASAAVFSEATQSIEDSGNSPLARLPRAEKFLLPLKMFADQAAVGVVNLTNDRSGTPRGVPMLCRTGDKIELSFPLRAAALATGAEPTIGVDGLTLAGRHTPTDIGHVLPLAFYGRHGTIRTVSAIALLNNEVPPETLRDRIVVIGATVTGGGDVFSTPFDPSCQARKSFPQRLPI